MTAILTLAGVVVIGVTAIPMVRRVNDRRTTRWLDAWLKAIVIFSFATLFIVFLPSYVMQHDQVTKLDSLAQDLIGSAVWGGGLVAVLWILVVAHRLGRV